MCFDHGFDGNEFIMLMENKKINQKILENSLISSKS